MRTTSIMAAAINKEVEELDQSLPEETHTVHGSTLKSRTLKRPAPGFREPERAARATERRQRETSSSSPLVLGK